MAAAAAAQPLQTGRQTSPASVAPFNFDTVESHGFQWKKEWAGKAKNESGGRGVMAQEIKGLTLEQVHAFRDGETARCGAPFRQFHQDGKLHDDSHSRTGGQPAKPFSYAQFRCANYAAPTVKKEEDRQRQTGNRVVYGANCPAAFTAQLDRNTQTYTIRYLVWSHSKDCRGLCEGGPLHRSPQANEMLRALVANNLTMPTHQLIREHMRAFVYNFMMEHGFESEDAVLEHWTEHPEDCPRDAVVSEQDISNFRQRASEQLWRLAQSDAESIELWVAGHADCVVHYQRQDKPAGQPFVLVFCTKDMVATLKKNGQKGTVRLDDTFGARPLRHSVVPAAIPSRRRTNDPFRKP